MKLAAMLWIAPLSLTAAPTVKRLLILNPVNEGGEANAYIGPSLADALRTGLGEKYFFIHPEAEAIESVQKENLIQDEDLGTKSAALQMGAWLRQDLVLGGRYSVAANKLKLQLILYEISGEKVLFTFKSETPISSQMFNTFSKITNELAEQMAQALPSQQELTASGGSFYDPEKGKRTVLLSFGTRAVGFAKTNDNLSSATTISTAESLHFNAELAYQRHNAGEILNRRYKWPVFLQFSLNGGYAKKNYTRDNTAIPTRLIAIEALPAIGYAVSLARGLRFEPYLGVGIGYSNYNFDYTGLARKPVDTSAAQSVSSQIIEQYYFFSQAGLIGKYAITPRWAILLIPSVTMFHFSGGIQAEVNAKIGAGFYF